MDKKKYVAGFNFDKSIKKVMLIRKNRPEWQAGKLNGIGGKIENGEEPVAAMVREFKEETNMITQPEEWNFFVILEGTSWIVYFFYRISTIDFYFNHINITDETVTPYSLSHIPLSVIKNLNWLIPLALDKKIKFPINIKCKE